MRPIALLIAAAVLAVMPARADQNDPRLNDLFQALAQAKTQEVAAPIEGEIWSIWQEAPSPTTALLLQRSSTSAESGDLDTSLRLMDTLVTLDPHFAEGWNMRATLHVMREEPGKAIADIEKALQLEPRHFAALAGLGQILANMGDDKGALRAFDAALKINPSLSEIRTAADALRRKVEGDPI